MNHIIAGLIALSLFSAVAEAKHRSGVGVSFGIFYSSLSDHGEWIEAHDGYVWRPVHTRHGWRPYMEGRWVWSDYGWYWVSYEPFGWATYHYGRWAFDDYYGWVWVPDNVWGPSWVEWRYNDDYIGWAPLPPHARFDVRVGVSFPHRWEAPVHYWSFVSCDRFTSDRVVEYMQPSERSRRIFGSTRGRIGIESDGDRVMNRGVDVRFIERRGKMRIGKVEVVERSGPGSERVSGGRRGERVESYRPRMSERNGDSAERPSKVRRAERPINLDAPDRSERNGRERLSGDRVPERREMTGRKPERSRERMMERQSRPEPDRSPAEERKGTDKRRRSESNDEDRKSSVDRERPRFKPDTRSRDRIGTTRKRDDNRERDREAPEERRTQERRGKERRPHQQ